ncbi:ATPase [Ancylothrix sp. C2]|uniref:N-acetylglucosamine kinase n=1 Tax=Ancylothrix sp. D3o TaxID=2953691 RepID=UPI0021BB6E2D|nr:BadF/BadG/BcrA/BcrD ATPase family protein [Ancylothrix sp. D3o]MCT7951166.1 ATPase [Ancylothrix sp. D3o]
MGYFLGIDGGGTKTVCVLMDRTANVLGRGEAGASNYQSVGLERAGLSIYDSIYQALASFNGNLNAVEIDGICLGLAGAGRPEDVEILQCLLRDLQEKKELPVVWNLKESSTIICNDCEIALTGGVGEPVGVVAIAGTGAICYGRNRKGVTQRASGWGYILGDEGGGYDIALRGLKAVVRSYDGREKPTILMEKLIKKLDLKSVESLIEVVYRRGWGVREIAGLAVVVGEAAAEGDVVANEIINDVVEELVLAVKVVGEKLFLEPESFDVVTVGGVWRGMADLRENFVGKLAEIMPNARVIWAKNEPAFGAGLLAIRG